MSTNPARILGVPGGTLAVGSPADVTLMDLDRAWTWGRRDHLRLRKLATLTVDHLKNGKYLIPSWENPDQGEWVQLKNGEFTRRNPDNPLFVNVVKIALGHLSNHQSQMRRLFMPITPEDQAFL